VPPRSGARQGRCCTREHRTTPLRGRGRPDGEPGLVRPGPPATTRFTRARRMARSEPRTTIGSLSLATTSASTSRFCEGRRGAHGRARTANSLTSSSNGSRWTRELPLVHATTCAHHDEKGMAGDLPRPRPHPMLGRELPILPPSPRRNGPRFPRRLGTACGEIPLLPKGDGLELGPLTQLPQFEGVRVVDSGTYCTGRVFSPTGLARRSSTRPRPDCRGPRGCGRRG